MGASTHMGALKHMGHMNIGGIWIPLGLTTPMTAFKVGKNYEITK